MESNTSIKNNVNHDLSNALIMVNGKNQNAEYILQSEDICAIRVYPASTTTNPDHYNPLDRVKSAMVDVTNNAIEFLFGKPLPDPITKGLKGETGGIDKPTHEGTIADLLKPTQTPVSDDGNGTKEGDTTATTVLIDKTVEQIPQLKGARNKSLSENPYPIVLGEHLLTPMYIGYPYTSIDPATDTYGEKQYYTILLMLGYSKLQVTDIKLGNILIAKNTEGIVDGLIPVYENSIYKNNIKAIEIRQGLSEVSLYPQKIIEERLNITLLRPANEDPLVITRFSEKYPQKIQLEFFLNGLFQFDAEGTLTSNVVSVQIEWSKNGGVTWNPFPQITNSTSYNADGTSTFILNLKKQMRFIAEKTFTMAETIDATNRVIELRVKRITPETSNPSMVSDTIILTAIRTWCYDYEQSLSTGYLVPQVPIIEKDRNKTCRLAIKIEASETLNADIGMINMLVKSYARIWDGNTETWSTDEHPTNNPASLLLKLYQHPTLSRYTYPDSKIDLMKFGELYEFCQTKSYFCNGIITVRKQLKYYADVILSTCRAYRTLNGKKQSLFIDIPRSTPVTILSNQNIISTQNSKDFVELPDGLRVKFINKHNDYQMEYIYVMLDGKSYTDPDVVFEDIEFPFVTDPAQCWKLGRFILAEKVLRPEFWQRKISIDGNLLFVGALVEIQDDTLSVGIGDGAEVTELIIVEGDLVGIKTDGSFTVTDLTKTYGVKIVQANGYDEPIIRTASVTITEQGLYSEFTFITPIPLTGVTPTKGDTVSFGILDRISTQALVSAIQRNEEGSFDVSFVPYDPAVYAADTEVIPPFNSKVTSPQTPVVLEKRPPQYISKNDMETYVKMISTGDVDSPTPSNLTIASVIAERDKLVITATPLPQGLKNSLSRIIYEIQKTVGGPWEVFTRDTYVFEYYFDRAVDGYPEAGTVLAKDLGNWRIRAKAVNVYDKTSEGYGNGTSGIGINVSSYGTWKPAKPTGLKLIAEEKRLTGRYEQNESLTYYGSTVFDVKLRYNTTIRMEVNNEPTTTVIYDFDRAVDGYPEKTVISGIPYLGNYNLVVTAKDSLSGNTNISTVSTTIDSSNYATWIPTAPIVFNIQSANRSIVLGWQIPLSSGIYIYGLRFYEIQISKDGTNWYKPETAKTGKVSESDWYNGTGQVRVSGVQFAQSLPLTGQTSGLPENTTYYYRVRTIGVTDSYISAWSTAQTGIALATGIGDIIEGAVKEAQLDDSSVSNIKIKDGTIIASEKVVTNSITTELLNVLAKNKINNFSITGTLEGWTTTGTLEDDASGFKKLRFTNSGFLSNVFTVQPNEICSFEFGISCPNYTSLSGAYIGLTAGQSFKYYAWNFTLNKWVAGVVLTNAYFITNYRATTVKYFKTYILGSNVSINDIPAPSATDTTYLIRALQLQGTDTTARIRTGFDPITPGTYWELYLPQVYSGQGGKIVAQQIVTPSLSSINVNAGEITSGILRAIIKAGESKPNVFLDLDTEEFRVGNNPSLEDSNHADAEYLHWKPNRGLFLKLKNLIVDAIASTIRGRFRVRGTTATMAQSVLIVNPESTVDPDTNTPANTTQVKQSVIANNVKLVTPLTGWYDGFNVLQHLESSGHGAIAWLNTADGKGWMLSFSEVYGVSISRLTAKNTGSRTFSIRDTKEIQLDNKKAIGFADAYLRLNESNAFTSGIWLGTSALGGNGEIGLGSQGSPSTARIRIIPGSYNGANGIVINGATGNISALGGLSGTNFDLYEDAAYVNLHTKNAKPLYLNAVNARAYLYGTIIDLGSAGQKVGILTSNTSMYQPDSTYPVSIGEHVHMNNKSIDYAARFHCNNNGNGDLRISTKRGALTGYPNSYHPTIKTNAPYLYFDIASTHAFSMGSVNGSTYITAGANTKLSSSSPFYGAVGNDICDNFKIASPVQDFEYGYCYCEDKGEYRKGNRGIIGITSDTASLHCGSDDGMEAGKDYLPIAIGGFVLAFVDRKYRRGTPLKAKKDGSLTRAYWFTPCWKIVATYQEEPKEETWNKAKVNGRTIVRVK